MPRKAEYRANKEHYRAYNKKYLKTWRSDNGESYKDYLRRYFTDYRKQPEQKLRMKARNAVNYAISGGKLKRELCEIAECSKIGEAHHEDYDKPLEVVWLCKLHHENQHHN